MKYYRLRVENNRSADVILIGKHTFILSNFCIQDGGEAKNDFIFLENILYKLYTLANRLRQIINGPNLKKQCYHYYFCYQKKFQNNCENTKNK